MKTYLLKLAPLTMLALAACGQTREEQAAAEKEAKKAEMAQAADATPLPPAITASAAYRCADKSVVYVDFYGANEGAAIRVGDKSATPLRVNAPKADAAAAGEAKPAGPMKSDDGKTMLAGSGDSVNLTLEGKGAQTCKK